MGGLTGVGTYPEYTNMGLMHKLLEQALKNMQEARTGYLLSVSIFHSLLQDAKGWEIISDKISYEIKDYQLPKNHQVRGDVRRVKTEDEELKRAYERFAREDARHDHPGRAGMERVLALGSGRHHGCDLL